MVPVHSRDSIVTVTFKYYFFLYINLFILSFGCVGSLLLPRGLSLVGGERGLLFVAVHGLLIAVASLVAEHRP